MVSAVAAMREPTFLILTALADRPRYGYGIVQEVRSLSDGRVSLLTGTLYSAVDRLTAEGLVERDHDEEVDGRVRRYYRLTAEGLAALTAETARLRQLTSAAEARLRAARPRAV